MLDDFRENQNRLVRLAEKRLRAFLGNLDLSDASAVTAALEDFMPLLVEEYGRVSASMAADLYEELRDEAQVARRYKATVAEGIPAEQVMASTRWATGPLFAKNQRADIVESNLTDITDRLVKQNGRNTLAFNADQDPERARFARVPTGVETCQFCVMLGSRGAVYTTSKAAGDLIKFHGRCDCVVTPVWNDSDYDRLKEQTGYDPEGLYQQYLDSK